MSDEINNSFPKVRRGHWQQQQQQPSVNVSIITNHYNDVIMRAMAYQITSLTIVYSTAHSGAHQRKHQSSTSLAFVRGIHRSLVNYPHKGPVTRKMFPFDDVIMWPLHPLKNPLRFETQYVYILFAQSPKNTTSGLILGLHPSSERRRYKVTPSLIGWAQT